MKYASFDIFDTCLIRTCGTPENFFDILSMQVFKKKVSENERQGFVIARREIEYKLYYNNPNANIFDIYNALSYNHPDIISNDEIREKEMALEKEVIVPVLKVKELINSHRDKGDQILFISDMYLPVDFLTNFLLSYGILQPCDKIFVSCNVGKTKFNGEIYKYIHEKEKIPYNKWTHYGDNRRSDIIEPKKLGIKTKIINHLYNTYEQDWIDNGCATLFKHNQIIAGISRSLNYSLPNNPRKKLLLDIVAPLYVSFIGYVFEEASKREITHLFFCARDTYQLFQVAKVFDKYYPNITIHYLRVSRKSLSDSSHQTLINYFKQEGLASKKYKTAVIDSVASGGSFLKIKKILKSGDFNEPFGFFILKRANSLLLETDYSSIIRQEYVIKNKYFYPLFKDIKIITLLENIFSSNSDKRTIGYKMENGIIKATHQNDFDNEDSIQDNVEEMQRYHTAILSFFAKQYINLGLLPYSLNILHEIAIPSFGKIAYHPTKEFTESLLSCHQKEEDKILPYVKKESLFRLFFTKGHDTCWSRATIFYNTPTWTHRFLLKYINYKESL